MDDYLSRSMNKVNSKIRSENGIMKTKLHLNKSTSIFQLCRQVNKRLHKIKIITYVRTYLGVPSVAEGARQLIPSDSSLLCIVFQDSSAFVPSNVPNDLASKSLNTGTIL